VQTAAALSPLIGSVPLDAAALCPSAESSAAEQKKKNVEEVSSCNSESQTHIALINK